MFTDYNKRLTQKAQWCTLTSTPSIFGDSIHVATISTISCYAYYNLGGEKPWNNPIPKTIEWAILLPLSLANSIRESDIINQVVTHDGQIIIPTSRLIKLFPYYHYTELRALVGGLERN